MNLRAVWRRTRHWAERPPGAIVFLLFGLGLGAVYFAAETKFPVEDELESASGRVLWTQAYKSSLYVAMSSNPSQFVLYGKDDVDGKLARAVIDAATSELTVRFLRADGAEPLFLDGIYYPVYLISRGGSELATLDEVHAAYSADNQVALAVGISFVVLGVARLLWFVRRRRLTSSNHIRCADREEY